MPTAQPRTQNRGRKAPLAVYANYCEIGHNAFEFLIDFGQFRPEEAAVQLHSRIVSGPVQAKIFARLLMRSIDCYEAEHGPIVELDHEDAFELLFASDPDFERRAISARRARNGDNEPAETPPTPAPEKKR